MKFHNASMVNVSYFLIYVCKYVSVRPLSGRTSRDGMGGENGAGGRKYFNLREPLGVQAETHHSSHF